MKHDRKTSPRKTPPPPAAKSRDPSNLQAGLLGKSLDAQRAMLRPTGSRLEAQRAARTPAAPTGATAPETATSPEKQAASAPVSQAATDQLAAAADRAATATGHRAEATEAASGLLDELSGWADFALTTLKYIQFDGMLDRAMEVSRAVSSVKDGIDADDLDIDANDHRLRNVAEMQEVIEAQKGKSGQDEQLAADGLRDANGSFYVLLGNNAGRFDGMDMERYRKIGAMNVDEATKVLPQFEAELFASQTDSETIDFGDSLSAKHRADLFKAYNVTMKLADNGAKVIDALGDAGRKAGAWIRDLADM